MEPTQVTDFARLRSLFEQALSISPQHRDVWLQGACQGDTTLYRQLQEMLSTSAGSFLQDPAHVPPSLNDTGHGTSQYIGRYRVVRELGRGGMGVVYLAMRDDGAFRKSVAIKLLLGETMTPEAVARFKQERQVVAALDHPNIARILDGGDDPNGVPYYVMEYVEGLQIDKYCDDKRLSLTNRIKLFQQVCQAVDYLHQNLIVHRDLKPNNILVSADGIVKLLDFGIVKMVGAAAAGQEMTTMPVGPMTPVYASPEQIMGATLTPASDIYSLGVVLYKLLTGRIPFETYDEKIAKMSARESPPLPSANIRQDLRSESETTEQLKRMMMGGLDSAVLMSMQYDPKKRYQSSLAFSNDLTKFLSGDAMTAYREAYSVRSMKAIKRKRALIAVGAVMLLLAGFGGWQYTRAAEARSKIAQLQAVGAQTVQGKAVDQLLDDVLRLKKTFETEYSALPASRAAEKQTLLDRGVQYLDKVRSVSPTDQRLGLEVADAYRQLGALQGRDSNPKSREKAVETYKKAAGVLVTIATANPGNTRAKSELDQINGQLQAWNVNVQVSQSSGPVAPDAPRPQTPQIPNGSQAQHKSQPASLTPPPNVVAPPVNVVVTAGPDVVVSQADIAEVQSSLATAEGSVQNAEQQIQQLQRNLQSQGQELNANTLEAKTMMRVKLEQAQRYLAIGNLAAAKKDIQAAEVYAGRVLKSMGR